jgi:FtsP/CotA-like multicopper oxidase with cupredoxin domain
MDVKELPAEAGPGEKSGLTRREMLRAGVLGGAALATAGGALALPGQAAQPGPHPGAQPGHAELLGAHGSHESMMAVGELRPGGFDPAAFLGHFDGGKVSRLPSGQTLREFEIVAQEKEIEVAPGVFFPAWTYNGQVPGPTIRCTEGDRLRVNFVNGSTHPHTIHFHGIHPAGMDGSFEIVPPGGRPPAKELVMVMNGFDTNLDGSNEVYAVNTVAHHYQKHPIVVGLNELVRVYLVNVTEFDLINSLHLHGNLFRCYRTGTNLEHFEFTDTVMLCQGERAVLEFSFKYPGKYMFHAHQSEFAELGWTGVFDVQGGSNA